MTQDTETGTWYVSSITVLVSGYMFTGAQIDDSSFITIAAPPAGPYALNATAQAVGYPIYYTIVGATPPVSSIDSGGISTITRKTCTT